MKQKDKILNLEDYASDLGSELYRLKVEIEDFSWQDWEENIWDVENEMNNVENAFENLKNELEY